MHKAVFAFAAALAACWAPAVSGQSQSLESGPRRMELRVERREGDTWRAVDPALVFSQGDRIRFRFSTNFDGFLYVMNQSTSGKYELLFPREDTGQSNRIEAGKTYVVPATQGWFRISGPPGHDVVYWMVSPVEIGDRRPAYVPLPPPPPPEAPKSFHPRCDDTIFKARGDCIDTSAGAKQVKPGEKLPENLSAVPGATSRELLFIQEQKALVVSSPAPLAGPVIYEVRIAHR